ncbi:limbic system-associated membrane protein-like isoform X2 [Ctenocephalides felis]|uniref:limbic system-associated membrane protein-like isoform X2 n=1 Tax=Ctenocephalides felis TaxID=7515 RepID=UPI000E6E2309|nr:limbic system-associated membrane protein-like isoform X2 [Ctenocephalides felis]
MTSTSFRLMAMLMLTLSPNCRGISVTPEPSAEPLPVALALSSMRSQQQQLQQDQTQLPQFITPSQVYRVVSGDTLRLPCEVTNPGSYVLAWKRGIAVLTAGTVKVSPDPRLRLVEGYSLEIRDAGPQDAGDYVCQIGTFEPREITHTVEIMVPPRIHHVTSNGRLQVKMGSPVRLECAASGNPPPVITWSRKNNLLPSGEETQQSPTLNFDKMDRHQGGVYLCTASNGVGQPVTQQIVLHVLYPPEIVVERQIVYSGEGQEAQLVCIVYGEAQPEVLWYRDTLLLDTTERRITETRGAKHTLFIRKVQSSDFGNYTCVADNQLGKSRKTVTLTGRPKVAVFQSGPTSQWRDRYNISWAVDSHAPVEEFKLFFRRLPTQGILGDSGVLPGDLAGEQLQPLQHQSQQHGRRPMRRENDTHLLHGYNGYMIGSHSSGWGRNEWRDVVLPAMPLSQAYTQSMSYVIRGLQPDAQYEAQVQSRNRYGWSLASKKFTFTTSSNDSEMRGLGVTQYNEATISRSSSRICFIFIFILLTLF